MINMKHLALLVATMIVASSCIININSKIVRGNGIAAQKTVEVTDFDAVSVLGSMDVVYTQSEEPVSVVLHADENLIDLIVVEVKDNKLVVSTEKGYSISPKADTYVSVKSPGISSASIIGSGDIEIKDALVVDGPFRFSVTGSGDLEADSLICKELECSISGSGDIDAGPVTAESISLSIAGSGDIDLKLKDAGDVKARISGSGDISLYGNAGSLDSKVTGSGDVHTTGLKLN